MGCMVCPRARRHSCTRSDTRAASETSVFGELLSVVSGQTFSVLLYSCDEHARAHQLARARVKKVLVQKYK